MNVSKSASESSCSSSKSEENGVASTESDRPLKKARFAWEVKGKYYLKNDVSGNKSEISSPDSSDVDSSVETRNECTDLNSNFEPKLDNIDDILEEDLCTLDSMSKPDVQEFPYISTSQEQNEESSPQHSNDGENHLDYENQSLELWQQEQMTKCLIENSLNSYYESTNSLLHDLFSDRQVEDEGILMAISTHGLQNTSSSSDNETDSSISPSSSINSEECMNLHENLDDQICTQSRTLSNYLVRSHSYINAVDCYGSNDTNSHCDFLDTAVSFAIQYKGLTSHGSDYG